MAIVIADLTEGNVRRDSGGWSATRVCDVSDVGGEAIAKPYQAAIAVESQLGIGYGSPHPVIPGITVAAVNVEHVNGEPDIYRVTAEYRGDSEGAAPGLVGSGIKGVEVSTGTLRTTGIRDWQGNLMLVSYQGPEVLIPGASGGAFSPGSESQTIRTVFSSAPAEAEFDLPTTTVTVIKEKPFPSFIANRALASRVNVEAWSGLEAYQWLSLGIDSSLNDSGSYDWRYVFAIAPAFPDNDTWRFRAELNVVVFGVFRPETTLGNGIELFDIYQPINFAQSFGFSVPYA